MEVDRYKVRLTFQRNVLATNPCDPNVHDQHILSRQRKLILDKNQVNTAVNKYLDQIQISAEKGDEETHRLVDKLEEMTGVELSAEERKLALAGKLESLKETLNSVGAGAGTTVFFWDKETDRPCIGDHMIYGYLKAAAEALGRAKSKDAAAAEEKTRGVMLKSISYTQSIINQHIRCEQQFIAFDNGVVETGTGQTQYLQRSLRAMTAQGPRVTLAKSEQVKAGSHLEFTLKVLKGSPLTETVLKQLFDYGEFTGFGQWRNAGYGMFSYTLEKI